MERFSHMSLTGISRTVVAVGTDSDSFMFFAMALNAPLSWYSPCSAATLPSLSSGEGLVFGAVRFGFREALATWPENAAAREGLAKATRYMIEYELRQGDPRAALPLMAELETPDVSIKTRIDQELELKAAAEKERDYIMALPARLRRVSDRMAVPKLEYQFKWIS